MVSVVGEGRSWGEKEVPLGTDWIGELVAMSGFPLFTSAFFT